MEHHKIPLVVQTDFLAHGPRETDAIADRHLGCQPTLAVGARPRPDRHNDPALFRMPRLNDMEAGRRLPIGRIVIRADEYAIQERTPGHPPRASVEGGLSL